MTSISQKETYTLSVPICYLFYTFAANVFKSFSIWFNQHSVAKMYTTYSFYYTPPISFPHSGVRYNDTPLPYSHPSPLVSISPCAVLDFSVIGYHIDNGFSSISLADYWKWEKYISRAQKNHTIGLTENHFQTQSCSVLGYVIVWAYWQGAILRKVRGCEQCSLLQPQVSKQCKMLRLTLDLDYPCLKL